MPVSVVTGASGGIGRWIALGLAQAGHSVVLVARDAARGGAAADWIGRQVAGAEITLQLADLSLMAATRAAGHAIAARHPAIDVLVNNAGIFRPRRELTAEGHERVLATNHLAPFVLTRALLPALRAAPRGARIVNIGSSTSDRARIFPDDLEGARRWGLVHTYGQSKLALMMATFGFAHRLRGSGVVANVVHPGAVASGLVRAPGAIGLAWRAMAPFLLTEAQGADSPVYVATAPAFAATTGAYVKKRAVVPPNPRALDAALCGAVWAATEALVAGYPSDDITGGVSPGPGVRP
jgi:NAD(P)-dependent dehydrogenase (short-subunit alcohol dehydrogenase family)